MPDNAIGLYLLLSVKSPDLFLTIGTITEFIMDCSIFNFNSIQ